MPAEPAAGAPLPIPEQLDQLGMAQFFAQVEPVVRLPVRRLVQLYDRSVSQPLLRIHCSMIPFGD